MTDDDFRFSICIPTYNRAGSIRSAIDSALKNAEGFDCEIVVVDNHSGDDTVAIVESIDDPRIRLVCFGETTSMYGNHNRCIDAAKGQWIIFLHSDDTLPTGFLASVDRKLQGDPDADLFTNVSLVYRNEDLQTISDQPSSESRTIELIARGLAGGGAAPSGSLYRRACFDRSGFFDTDHLYADLALTIRWMLDGRRIAHFRPDPPVWVAKPESASSNIAWQRDHWSEVGITYRLALEGPYREEICEAMVRAINDLTPCDRIKAMSSALGAGQRKLAWRMWRGQDSPFASLLRYRFYFHVVLQSINRRLFRALHWRSLRLKRKLMSLH